MYRIHGKGKPGSACRFASARARPYRSVIGRAPPDEVGRSERAREAFLSSCSHPPVNSWTNDGKMEDVNVQDPAAPSQARGASHTASTSSAAESGDGDVDDGKGIPSSLTPQEGSPEKDTTPAASQEETSSTTVGDAVESATPTPASSLAPAAADDDEEEQSTHPAATEAEGVDRVDQEGGGDTTITSSAGPHQGTGTDDGAAAATSHHNDSTNLNRLVLEKYAMYKTESVSRGPRERSWWHPMSRRAS